jgi:glycine/D-amino acid oxidase-like deaminating enzyme
LLIITTNSGRFFIMKNITILGSGIQGLCSAFALNEKGFNVTIVEKETELFNKTSRNQEGRVHMGFTYGLDRSGVTGEDVMNNSLHFSGLLEQWLGRIDWNEYLMPKGYYLVDKTSMLSTDELNSYYEKLQNIYSEILSNNPQLTYFGKRPTSIFKKLKNIPRSMSHQHLDTVFITEERIVEMFYLRDLLLKKLNQTNIHIVTNTEVERIERDSSGFSIIAKTNNEETVLHGDIVVNCLWNNRLQIDKTLGISTLDEPLYRFKVGILGTVDELVPTCSITTGVYGNISPRLDKRHAYISWHKDCMKELTTNGCTPPAWESSFSEYKNFDPNEDWIKCTIENLIEYVPALKSFKPTMLLPGIICSAGKSDIGDKNSNVHKRGAHMGVYEFDDYYTVDTGKFCSAPYFAHVLADKVVANAQD